MLKGTRKIKDNLNTIIKQMSENTVKFARNPEIDFTRKRKLSFSETLKVLLTMGGNSLSCELLKYFDYDENAPTSSAFIQQRSKINDFAMPFLFHQFTNTAKNLKTHKGYRLLATDGTFLNISVNLNDSDSYYRSKSSEKGYNQLHLSVFYDLCNKIYADVQILPRRKADERRALVDMLGKSNYSIKTIIIADRGYESYNVFANIEQKGYKYAIRVKDMTRTSILSTLPLPETSEFDVSVSLNLTRSQAKEVKYNCEYKYLPSCVNFDFLEPKESGIYRISFRVVRFEVSAGKYESIITNLDKSEFSAVDIKKIYQMRWGIETSFRELKYSIGLVNLHAKKRNFIRQEIFARLIMYNFCSMVIAQIVIKQKSTKHYYQANFTMAVQVCKLFLRGKAPPGKVETLIQKHILPIRENRANARNISAKTFVSFTYRVA